MWETSTSCLPHVPQLRIRPQPQYVPWQGVELTTFSCTGGYSNQLSNPARAPGFFLYTQCENWSWSSFSWKDVSDSLSPMSKHENSSFNSKSQQTERAAALAHYPQYRAWCLAHNRCSLNNCDELNTISGFQALFLPPRLLPWPGPPSSLAWIIPSAF